MTDRHDPPRSLIDDARSEQAMSRLRDIATQLMQQVKVVAGDPPGPATTPRDNAPSIEQQRAAVRELQLQRQLEQKVEAIGTLQKRLDGVRQRREEQTGAYLAQIEQQRQQVLDLRMQLEDFKRGRGLRARSHRRFLAHNSHLFVDALLTQNIDPRFLRDLTMDAPLFTRTNFQPVFKLHDDGEYDLVDFLQLHDRNFVRAAYVAILRREPDPEGAANYLALVRSGENKAKLLNSFLQSPEAQRHRTDIRGLSQHLRVLRWCEMPWVGRVIEAALFLGNLRAHLQDLRALENHVIRIAEETQALHEANLNKLRSLSK